MNAKTLAHSIQAGLKLSTGLTLKRSHIHELVASAFGFGSHAALLANNVLCEVPTDTSYEVALQKTDIASRAVALGYPAVHAEGIADEVAKQTRLASLFLLPLEALLDRQLRFGYDQIEGEFPIGEEGEYLDLTSDHVASALAEAAERGDARAHLALALLHSVSAGDTDTYAGRYWFEQELKGKSLAGVEKEWADAYRNGCAAGALAKTHLQSAADLGHADALLLMAAQHDDKRFFDLANPVFRSPARFVAEVAEKAQLPDQAHRWLETAAAAGDIEVIARLMEMTSDSAPLECWTWYELGKLHGTDLAEDDYRAIHEDGSAYDDDVGGPMFAGGSDGMELPEVDESIKRLARERALQLYRAS